MGDLTETSTPPQPPTLTPPSRTVPSREDCWTEEATATLVESWGRRFLELNRGNLRQKDWQEVAETVNASHGHTKKTRRTDVQCKNRIDTLKKKYKTEKAKIAESNETLTSSWPFFSRLDYLIGSSFKNQAKPPPTMAMPLMIMAPPSSAAAASSSVQIQSTMPFSLPSPPMAVPLPYRKPMVPTMSSVAFNSPMVMPQKRPSPSPGPEESLFRRNYSAVAAAAAAMNDDDEASDEDDEENGVDEDMANISDEDEEDEGVGDEIGLKRLAKAIENFAEIYEKVEGMKQKQMIELEKQRMQFAKDLEVQRMQLFMDTQVQTEKMKRAKRSTSSDGNDES